MSLRTLLLLCTLLFTEGNKNDCECPTATVLVEFPASLPVRACCLNYSGSDFSHVQWGAFSSQPALRILDLSHCNISQIYTEIGETPTMLRELLLGHNNLSALPEGFLTTAPRLRVLDLSMNQLEGLPDLPLWASEELWELDLRGNRLTALPSSILTRHVWRRLDLSSNPWDCTCSLVGDLHTSGLHNSTMAGFGGGSSPEDMVGNLTCASPWRLAGENMWSVQKIDVCQAPGLTSLFILLPLFMLTILVLCLCCGGKRKRKETSSFWLGRRKRSDRCSQLLNCNGRWNNGKQTALPAGELTAPREDSKEGIMKNQLMLRPSVALLGSMRDIYEEVEIPLGSVESLTWLPSSISNGPRQASQELNSKTDLETVSVTEVMKDSADREKAYMTQSTEYYSLVPTIEIEDSDHGEFESVDLS